MADVSQIYTIVNSVAKQTLGESAIEVVDSSTMIALGDKVLSSDVDTDNFTNNLVDRIGKTVFSVRNYTALYPDVVKHPFEFGCIVQKIYVDLPDAKENNSWEIGKETYKPEYAPVIKANVKQKLFSKISTWEIDCTIPDYMLRTAFKDAVQMGVFINAIFTAMDNRMQIAIENMVDLTRASFIARKLFNKKPCGSINLLLEYNTLTNAGLTVNSCMRNVEFLKWASMTISIWLKRMTRMSKLFNDEGYARHTPSDSLVLTVLQDFASATDTFLQADTYHNELTKLPLYDTVPYWQGSGTSFDFNDTSKIVIKLDATNTITQTGVIAVAYDYEALGTTINERRSSTERNNKDEYTNYYNKANIGYFNDMSENGIVFYIAEA